MKKLIIMSVMLLIFTACKKEKECHATANDYGNYTHYIEHAARAWYVSYQVPNTSPAEYESIAQGLGNVCDFETWKNSYDFSNIPVDTIELSFLMDACCSVPPNFYIKIK